MEWYGYAESCTNEKWVPGCFVLAGKLQRRFTNRRCHYMNNGRNSVDMGSTAAPGRQDPYFDPLTPRNVTALVGKSAYLSCRVRNLGNRTSGWYIEAGELTTNIEEINKNEEKEGRRRDERKELAWRQCLTVSYGVQEGRDTTEALKMMER
ncbi:hypothetical protein J6590_023762 [Homalodisca vitripennis]|nr:hypothetical protein J6590_023762 [Homalodisca vitripennis]